MKLPLRKCVLSALVLALTATFGCGGSDGITGPTVPPTPPIPSPTPEPAPPLLSFPIRTAGTSFVDGSGRGVRLLGAIPCCGDPAWNDWPLTNSAVLREIAAAGGNWTHIRMGPHSEDLFEGPRFQPSEAFFAEVEDILMEAAVLGIVVEVDVLDSWAMKPRNQKNYFGWDCGDAQGPPSNQMIAWVNRVLDHTAHHANVIYQISNESFLCAGSDWESGIARVIRARSGHPIGSNLQRSVAGGYADYFSFHGGTAQPPFRGKPVMVNETGTNNYLSPEEWEQQARAAIAMGTSFHLWRGGMDTIEWENALARMKRIQEGH